MSEMFTRGPVLSGRPIGVEVEHATPSPGLAAMLEAGLGRVPDGLELDTIAAAQKQMWKTIGSLEIGLRNGDLTADDHRKRLDSAINLAMLLCVNVLGQERFDTIFGQAAADRDGPANREAFLSRMKPS